MVLKIIRNTLGQSIVFLNFIIPPQKVKRTQAKQIEVDKATESLALYQFYRCPFCIRVRRMITRLNLKIQYYDVNKNATYEEALKKGGGKRKVPCLRIKENNQTRWLYESAAINSYLETRFGD